MVSLSTTYDMHMRVTFNFRTPIVSPVIPARCKLPTKF